jgi:acetyltransferase-like isoleucine patch superfamily enzyme
MQGVFQRLLSKLASFMPGGFKLRPFLHRLRGVSLGRNVWISQYVHLDELHPEAITIGADCTIGLRTTIFAHLYWGAKRGGAEVGPVVIEDEVYVGPHCVILPNVHIGRGSVIQAGTVVSRNVPPGVLWGPPPAGPLGAVTTPLTSKVQYRQFVQGLRPIRKGETS